MLENIGWLAYLYTRLDAIGGWFVAFAIVSGILCFMVLLVYCMGRCDCQCDAQTEAYLERYKGMKDRLVWASGISLLVFSLLATLTPSKKDALLIAGVTVGVQVAEKTVDVVSKSELVGKVFEIVEARVDQTLADVKSQKKEK